MSPEEKRTYADICLALTMLADNISAKSWEAIAETEQDMVLRKIVEFLATVAGVTQQDINEQIVRSIDEAMAQIIPPEIEDPKSFMQQ